LVSAGFAGGLKRQHKAGDLLVCREVIDEQRNESFMGVAGEARLVTCAGVLNGQDKRKLAEKHDADAVDMEAAAVARVAREKGIAFVAVKAISDEVDIVMPPMDRFIDADGNFETVKLLAYAAPRPRLWPVLARLQKNTGLAAAQLCGWLEDQMDFQRVLAGAQV
jgi:adenosylhomocysteine nucleosidase